MQDKKLGDFKAGVAEPGQKNQLAR